MPTSFSSTRKEGGRKKKKKEFCLVDFETQVSSRLWKKFRAFSSFLFPLGPPCYHTCKNSTVDGARKEGRREEEEEEEEEEKEEEEEPKETRSNCKCLPWLRYHRCRRRRPRLPPRMTTTTTSLFPHSLGIFFEIGGGVDVVFPAQKKKKNARWKKKRKGKEKLRYFVPINHPLLLLILSRNQIFLLNSEHRGLCLRMFLLVLVGIVIFWHVTGPFW